MNLQPKVVFIVLLAIPYAALGLRCYKCDSWSSWEDCEERLEEFTCPDEHDERCLKATYNHELHNRKTFTKFCEKAEQCTEDTNPICIAAKSQNATCESYCCDHDLCNIGSYAITSGMLLVACALVSVAALFGGNNFNIFLRAE